MFPKKLYVIYNVKVRRALRILVRKVLGTPMLNPKVMPLVLEASHVHFFASILA
jgi:hypothetical protein